MFIASPDSGKILITGAAGNLGSILARRLASSGHRLRLMVHKTMPPADLLDKPGIEVVRADLSVPETLRQAVTGVDTIVHFAGVLFAPGPERFLPTTNTLWFSNLLDASLAARVNRLVLISFPHVEGPTTPARPATGRLDGTPISTHAQTRLEEEKLLFSRTKGSRITPVSLRLGMVYGRGILMVDAALWLARHRLLGVWTEPTWIHLVSIDDYAAATAAAATKEGISGIYHVGDEKPVTLQEFLDRACEIWGVGRPWRMPLWMIYAAAGAVELFARVFGTRAPLTSDFITIGRVSYCGDTTRTRNDLLPTLTYPSLDAGLHLLSRPGKE